MSDPLIWCLLNVQGLLHVHGRILELHVLLYLVSLKLLATQIPTEDTLELLGTACHHVRTVCSDSQGYTP